MRPDALRPATKKAAQATAHKLKTRLSKGKNATVNGSLSSLRSTTSHP